MSERPIVAIGGGPVGLAAAANLLAKGERPVVLEGGASVAARVLSWGHVRLFSVDQSIEKVREIREGIKARVEDLPLGPARS